MKRLFKNEIFKIKKQKKIFFFFLFITIVDIIFDSVILYNSFVENRNKVNIEFITDFPIICLVNYIKNIIPIIIIILGLFYISDEIHNGTLKSSLIYGYSKRKIILSKVLSIDYLLILVLLFATFILIITSTILKNIGIYNPNYYGIIDNYVIFLRAFLIIVILYMLYQPMIFLSVTIALLIKNKFLYICTYLFAILEIKYIGKLFPNIKQFLFTFYIDNICYLQDKKLVICNFKTEIISSSILIAFLSCIVFYIISSIRFEKIDI